MTMTEYEQALQEVIEKFEAAPGGVFFSGQDVANIVKEMVAAFNPSELNNAAPQAHKELCPMQGSADAPGRPRLAPAGNGSRLEPAALRPMHDH